MATIIAASTDTHFLLNGTKYPVSYKVYPEGSLDARLEDVDGSGSIVVLAGATVGGSVRATQDALIDALAAIVSPASAGSGGGSGATAPDIGEAVNTLPALTDRSGTVTTGGTAQDVMAANAARTWGSFVNLHTTAGWIAEGATAVADTAGSQSIAAGQTYLVEGRGRLSWLHATTGAKFTSREG